MTYEELQEHGSPLVWGAVVIAAVVVLVLAIGRDSRHELEHEHERHHAHDHGQPVGAAPAARSYLELRERSYWSATEWAELVGNLPMSGGAPRGETVDDVRDARRRRRAYEGAPPVVPHPIAAREPGGCLACHGEGMAFPGGPTAPVMSHAPLTSCTQCHTSEVPPFGMPDDDAREAGWFEAEPVARPGARAWGGAPPSMPHPSFMRERCSACHGPTGPLALRTDHPERASCQQCHAPSAAADQHPVAWSPGGMGEAG
jgi:cytochrome c-type protein NapB